MPDLLNVEEPPIGEKAKIYLQKALNTFFNPLTMDPNKYFSVSALTSDKPLWGKHLNIRRVGGGVREVGPPQLTDRVKTYNMLGSVAAKSAGFATLAAVAHLAARRSKNKKQQKNLRRYLNAAFPIVSLDPSTRDTVRERKERELGIRSVRGLEEEQEKTAQGESDAEELRFEELVQKHKQVGMPTLDTEQGFREDPSKIRIGLDPVFGWLNQVADKARLVDMPMHPVLQLAVPLAIAYGTYRGLDKVMDKTERQQLQASNERKKNLLQALMHSEFERVRGRGPRQKTAQGESGFLEEALAGLKKVWSGSEETRKLKGGPQVLGRFARRPLEFVKHTGSALWALWALTSTALAYTMVKKHFDRKDPRRKRAQQLERFMRRKAISAGPPMFISEEGLLLGKTDKKKTARKKKKTSVVIPEAREEVAETPVDKRDPYAGLLKV